jgi:hypothetical protein
LQCPATAQSIFSDLIGKLDLLRVACDKCGRDGCYGLHCLIEVVVAIAQANGANVTALRKEA